MTTSQEQARAALDDISTWAEERNILSMTEAVHDHWPIIKAALEAFAGGEEKPLESAADLTTALRDPRYWRDRDPDFVSKVTEAFRKIYG